MISEPHIFYFSNPNPTTHHHHKWQTVLAQGAKDENEKSKPIRSMMLVNNKLTNYDIIDVKSSDLTAISIQREERRPLAISVYVSPEQGRQGLETLETTMRTIGDLCTMQTEKWGSNLDILVMGDFNRHDQLWGGDSIATSRRQGEAQPIIDWMLRWGIRSALPRGTITYESGAWKTTIDLILASDRLFDAMTYCSTLPHEHGSDHRGIEIKAQLNDTHPQQVEPQGKYNLRSAP
ncbi:endonuclease/exonuclease/phosphatase [Penicillium sp. DV-2018c]|nr:endonuclease/exonuclease/phosphatase [Penicillium sp. DV-2018c]